MKYSQLNSVVRSWMWRFEKKHLVLFIPVLLCGFLAFLPFKYAASMLFIGLFALWLAWHYPYSQSLFTKVLWLAFFIRILYVFAYDLFPFLPYQPDADMYNYEAQRIWENIQRGLPIYYDIRHSLSIQSYSFFLSIIYGVFGFIPMLAQFINVFISLFSVILIYKIVMEVFENESIATLASILILFYPSFIAFTSFILRDALMMFLMVSLLFVFVRLYKGNSRIRNVFFFLIILALIGALRNQNLYLYSVFFLSFVLYLILKSSRPKWMKITILFFLISGLVAFLSFNQEMFFSVLTYPFRAQPLRVEGGSAYLTEMQYDSLLNTLIALPIRFIYFTYGPFLWLVYSPSMVLSAVEGMIILVSTWLTWHYFRRKKLVINHKLQVLLISFCITGLMANAMVDSNFGTAVRHRVDYVIFLLIFASASLQSYKFKMN